MSARISEDRRDRHIRRKTDNAVEDQPVALVVRPQRALAPEVELIRRLQVRDEVGRIVDRLRKGVRNLELGVARVTLRQAQAHAVIDRTAGRLHPVVLQKPWIDRAEHRPVHIAPDLLEVHIPGPDQFRSPVSEVVDADRQAAGKFPVDTQAELLAVRIHDAGIGIQQNRWCDAGLKSEPRNIGRSESPVAENILLLPESPPTPAPTWC